MEYRRSGRSGLLLPVISLGLWHNFGNDDSRWRSAARSSAVHSTSGSRIFDLANNHDPRCGSAEESFGRDSLAALDRLDFIEEELAEIDRWRPRATSISGPTRAASSRKQTA
jgi:aryl-alcohol dehydrogenase-like predicted oxidoreductase